MRFLIDANLPYRLAKSLKDKGYDIIHTDDLPDKERTKDNEIRKISVDQSRIIISKDSDFLDSHIIQGYIRLTVNSPFTSPNYQPRKFHLLCPCIFRIKTYA
jgi:predicted nuclease of predicted toxin-antitoxin system